VRSSRSPNTFRHYKQPIGKKDLELWVAGTYFAVQSAFYDQKIQLSLEIDISWLHHKNSL